MRRNPVPNGCVFLSPGSKIRAIAHTSIVNQITATDHRSNGFGPRLECFLGILSAKKSPAKSPRWVIRILEKTRAKRGFGVQKQYMVFELYAHMDWEGKQVEWVVLLTS